MIETWTRLRAVGREPRDKVFLEVGTGRVPLVPIAYWLMGASGTVTIDVNPYMRIELIRDSLRYMWENADRMKRLFGPFLDVDRWSRLMLLCDATLVSRETILELCGVKYLAPGDWQAAEHNDA